MSYPHSKPKSPADAWRHRAYGDALAGRDPPDSLPEEYRGPYMQSYRRGQQRAAEIKKGDVDEPRER